MANKRSTSFKTYEAQARLLSALLASHEIKIDYKKIADHYGDDTTTSAVEHRFRPLRVGARLLQHAVETGVDPARMILPLDDDYKLAKAYGESTPDGLQFQLRGHKAGAERIKEAMEAGGDVKAAFETGAGASGPANPRTGQKRKQGPVPIKPAAPAQRRTATKKPSVKYESEEDESSEKDYDELDPSPESVKAVALVTKPTKKITLKLNTSTYSPSPAPAPSLFPGAGNNVHDSQGAFAAIAAPSAQPTRTAPASRRSSSGPAQASTSVTDSTQAQNTQPISPIAPGPYMSLGAFATSIPTAPAPQNHQNAQNGYSQHGYSQNNVPQSTFSQGTFSHNSYPQNGYQHGAFPQNGYSQNRYSQNGFTTGGLSHNTGYSNNMNFPNGSFPVMYGHQNFAGTGKAANSLAKNNGYGYRAGPSTGYAANTGNGYTNIPGLTLAGNPSFDGTATTMANTVGNGNNRASLPARSVAGSFEGGNDGDEIPASQDSLFVSNHNVFDGEEEFFDEGDV